MAVRPNRLVGSAELAWAPLGLVLLWCLPLAVYWPNPLAWFDVEALFCGFGLLGYIL